MTIEDIASSLGGARRSGDGWLARCPAHDDREPSLSLDERDGRLLVHCHAGCAQRDVIAALKERGLRPQPEPPANGGNVWITYRDGIRYPVEWGSVVAEYQYTSETGEFLYSVFRFVPKSFRPGYYQAPGKWVWRRHPRQVPYQLPELLRNAIIFIVKGEKDVETLFEYGFVATTNAGGANGWRDEFNEVFRGKEVIIIPDNDPPGLARGGQIAKGILHVAAKTSVLILEGAKDVTEWFQQGHSEVEFIDKVENPAYAP